MWHFFFIRCYVKDGSYYHFNSKAIVKWFYNVKFDWHFYIPNHIVNELTDYSGEEKKKKIPNLKVLGSNDNSNNNGKKAIVFIEKCDLCRWRERERHTKTIPYKIMHANHRKLIVVLFMSNIVWKVVNICGQLKNNRKTRMEFIGGVHFFLVFLYRFLSSALENCALLRAVNKVHS